MEKKLHSAVPIYAAGLAVALYGLLFPLYAPLHILLSLVLGAAVYLLITLEDTADTAAADAVVSTFQLQ